ncbi:MULTISPECIES: META domain-containing protein [unclassified Helicobacter]|uniref:META domain-containing protein n=1 Tax=unclassified Helicobacter TaxID=2593540 RepID=UPI000CF0167C|nr:MULTISPECIES: META domain-containing protein [unclassified Helicobacter]
MRVIFILNLFCCLLGATSLSLALENKIFLGKWKIVGIEIDGIKRQVLDENSFIIFKEKYYLGNVGCNDFIGNYAIMRQKQIVLIPSMIKEKNCKIEKLNFEAMFLRYFMGGFRIIDEKQLIILRNNRLRFLLKRF